MTHKGIKLESKETSHKGDGNSGPRSYWNGWEMYRLVRAEGLRHQGLLNVKEWNKKIMATHDDSWETLKMYLHGDLTI